jgi:hypothetical protein
MVLVVYKTKKPPVWRMKPAPEDFPSLSMITLLLQKIPMLGQDVAILVRPFIQAQEANIRSTTNGLSVIASILSGSIGVTSIWSPLPQSKQSSTFTNMYTRDMTAPLWPLALLKMRLSSIWMHAMSVYVRQTGIFTSLRFRTISSVFCVLQFIFPSSRQLSFILIGTLFRRLLSDMKIGIPLLLDGSRPMLFIRMVSSIIPFIKTFLTRWFGTKTHTFWTDRQRGFQIGRMYYAHPSSGEHFYLCLLLSIVTGATSYEDLCTYQDITYPTFREACIAYSLTEDNNE